MKRCKKCNAEKNESEFYKYKKYVDGLSSFCKKCLCKYAEEYYKENEKNIERKKKEYKETHPKQTWCQSTLSTHKRRKISINITADELFNYVKNIENCEFCGEKLDWKLGDKKHIQKNSPTLDRLNNENYIDLKNIKVLCSKCNATKRDKTFKEFVDYCKTIANKYKEL